MYMELGLTYNFYNSNCRRMTCLQKFSKILSKSKFLIEVRTFASSVNKETSKDVFLQYLTENDKGIAVLNLNRHKQRNALSKSLVESVHDIVSKLVSTSDTRVLIIKSSVRGVFCAGADLKERIAMSENEVSQFTKSARSLMTKIQYLPIPVLAAIDGYALGGGLELALACDIRVATKNAKLGLVETRLAIIPGAGGTARLPRLINPAIAKELILTAKILNGSDAKELGLVNHAIEQNEDGDAAYLKSLEIAREILPNGPLAVEMAKFAINQGLEVEINTALAIEEASYAQIIPTKDRVEGLKAFSEKRPPRYIGE